MDRRDFLRIGGVFSVGTIGAGLPLLSAAARIHRDDEGPDAAPATQWAMVVDIHKCLSEDVRRACVEACRRAHNIPLIPDPEEEVKWIWTEQYEHCFPDQVHSRSALLGKPVLVLCNHCTNPPCVKVCPTGATFKRKSDGIVVMDMHRCIGCRYCMAACPYGARSFNWRQPGPYIQNEDRQRYPVRDKGVVEKCDFCSERIRDWQRRIEADQQRLQEEPEPVPACVEAARKVPGGEGALTFGDVSDPASNVSQLLRQNRTICRRPGLGTGPNVYYIV
jgi:Fe-S-cluster-containing dehydrogenase component